MRTALIHHWNTGGDVSDRVWNSLCRIWPSAERFTSDPWCSTALTDTTQWLNTTPRRGRALGESHLRRDQLLSRLPRDQDWNSALLEGFDLVVSTSLAAAQLITVKSDAMHVCFLAPEVVHAPLQEMRDSIADPAATRTEKLRELAHQTWQSSFVPKIWARDAGSLPTWNSGVTHYLTATHAMAAQFHFDLAGQPHAVLYPPVDTTFFRPGPDTHENFLLLVCHPGVETHVDLVIEACKAAHRDLVILGGDEYRSQIDSLPSQVRWEVMPDDLGLRSYYRRCRAAFSVGTSGFDPALVEAQACGTPVIACHHAANEEILIDAERSGLGTCLYFHSSTAASIVSAIQELERRPQNISAVLSLAQATKFSPAHFEHSLTHQIARWWTERMARKTDASPILSLQKPKEDLDRRRFAA
ncbi:MAG: mshA 6 [Planctomycetaceae bacterium]|nr:mshA 6 [Planctomycetaceae bacterium]